MPLVGRGVAEDHAGPGPGGRVPDVDVAEVADALRQRVGREPAARVDQDQPDPCVLPSCTPAGGSSRGRRPGDQPVSRASPVDGEVNDAVVVRQSLEVAKCGLVASLSVTLPVCTFWSGPNVRPLRLTVCGAAPVLVTVTGQRSGVPGCADRVELIDRGQERVAGRRGRAVRGVDRLGQLDRLVGVQQAGALLVAGAPRSVAVLIRICLTSAGVGVAPPWVWRYAWMTSGRGARPRTATTRWCRRSARRRTAGPLKLTQSTNSRASASHEAKLRSPGATRSTVRAGLGEAARAQRADVVVQPAGGREVAGRARSWSARRSGSWSTRPTEIRFGSVAGEPIVLVEPASPVETLTVTPAAHGGVVELRGGVQRGDVRERVGAERLVDHVDVVGLDRVVDRLQEVRTRWCSRTRRTPSARRGWRPAPRPRSGRCTAVGSGWALKPLTS